jgi:quinol monooxygenase YgiN
MKTAVFAVMISLLPLRPVHAEGAMVSPPIWMMVHHEVTDVNAWRGVFDGGLATRQSAGEISFQVFTHPDYPGSVTVIFEWDTAARARAFVDDPFVQSAMKAAGVSSSPLITFLEIPSEN